jgi:hypothetical protein
VIRTAYLRAYEPLDSFPEDDRARWLSHSEEAAEVGQSVSRKWLIARALPPGGGTADPTEGAFVRSEADRTLVCPWRFRLRMLAAMLAFRGSMPEEVAEAFVPENLARLAARELATLGDNQPDIRSHILHANWHVPLRWFAAFDESERVLTEDASGLRIRYEASIGTAKQRLARAHRILETSWVDESVTEAVHELTDWLQGFSDDGLLELDYGAVAGMFEEETLADDRSAAAVWTCLEALEQGDLVTAGRVFASLTEMWSEVRSHEVVN